MILTPWLNLKKLRSCTFVQIPYLFRYYCLFIILHSSWIVLPQREKIQNMLFTLYFSWKVFCINSFKNSVTVLGIFFSVDFIYNSTGIHSPQDSLYFFLLPFIDGHTYIKKWRSYILQTIIKKTYFYFENKTIEREVKTSLKTHLKWLID